MDDIITKVAFFFRNKPVKKAYLFGSAARGDLGTFSDVDILVDLDYDNGADFYAFIDMQDELSELLGTQVDLVSSNGLSPFIKPQIDQDKKLIYEKI